MWSEVEVPTPLGLVGVSGWLAELPCHQLLGPSGPLSILGGPARGQAKLLSLFHGFLVLTFKLPQQTLHGLL